MTELYKIPSFAMPTTAAPTAIATGAVIKTLLQVKLGRAVMRGRIVEWGISFDGSAAATPIVCELLSTAAIAATVSAHVANGILNLDPNGTPPTDLDPFDFGVGATGFNGTVEGTIVATRMHDIQFVAPTNQYIHQWPLGREERFDHTDFLRIRVTAPAGVNSYSYVIVEV